MQEATSQQLSLIRRIEAKADFAFFSGDSIEDASEFINTNKRLDHVILKRSRFPRFIEESDKK